MNHKKQLGIILFLVILVYSVIFIFGINKIFLSGDCVTYQGGDTSRCLGIAMFPDQFQALSLFSISLLPLLFLLIFTKEAVYLAWRKFALWFLPISALLIFSAPEYSGGGFIGMSYGFTREIMSMTLAVLFFVISLILIIYKSIKLRGK
jgi:hypothetical protein